MKKDLIELVFILDRSGSMAGLESDTVGGYNSFLDKHKGDKEIYVSTVLFDEKYEVLYDYVERSDAYLNDSQYYVRGMTALLDAIGRTINNVGKRLSNKIEDERPEKVIFIIITDGMENASTEFTYSKIKEMIKHQREKYSWEFIFLGANIDVEEEANKLGIKKEYSKKYNSTKVGTHVMYNMAYNLSENIINLKK